MMKQGIEKKKLLTYKNVYIWSVFLYAWAYC